MSGNVREWVSDYYEEFYYSGSPVDNPTGPESGSFHVVRDGGWHSGKGCCSVDARICLPTYWVDFAVGFRCAGDAD
jgi:formylglycine-generating enzyme required for sulfatase activity